MARGDGGRYGTAHKKLRARLAEMVEAGRGVCWRCGRVIRPDQAWDLGHDDYDRSRYAGPEHRHSRDCSAGGNRATHGRAAAPLRFSREW